MGKAVNPCHKKKKASNYAGLLSDNFENCTKRSIVRFYCQEFITRNQYSPLSYNFLRRMAR